MLSAKLTPAQTKDKIAKDKFQETKELNRRQAAGGVILNFQL